MNSIRRRLNSGAYNKTRNLKRNEQAVRKKLREFDKKGELRSYMIPRYDAALDLLGRLEEIKEVGAALKEPVVVPKKKFTLRRKPNVIPVATAEAPVPVPVPVVAAEAPAVPLMTLKKRRKVTMAPTGVPEFNPPPANLPAVPLSYGDYDREGEFLVRGTVGQEPILEEGEPIVENAARFGYVPKPKGPKVAKTLRKSRLLTAEEMPYLERVQGAFLPLPELYNPYTGVKYGPEEDPQPNIDSAHFMLEQIMEKAKRKALALKKREEKKARAVM